MALQVCKRLSIASAQPDNLIVYFLYALVNPPDDPMQKFLLCFHPITLTWVGLVS